MLKGLLGKLKIRTSYYFLKTIKFSKKCAEKNFFAKIEKKCVSKALRSLGNLVQKI